MNTAFRPFYFYFFWFSKAAGEGRDALYLIK